MRWRWTTPKTRGAAPRTKTPRARRSLRMEIAQVRDPAGWDPESSRQDSERPLSTRRQLRPAGRAGRGEREGAETGSRPSVAPKLFAGRCPAPGRSQLAGRSGAGRGPLDIFLYFYFFSRTCMPPFPMLVNQIHQGSDQGLSLMHHPYLSKSCLEPPSRHLLLPASIHKVLGDIVFPSTIFQDWNCDRILSPPEV